MKFFGVLLLALSQHINFIANNQICPRYVCDGDLGKDICGKVTIGHNDAKEAFKEIHLFPCSNHKQRCQISSMTDKSDARCVEVNQEKASNFTIKKLPGNKCTENNECISGLCANKEYCFGNVIGSLCTSHEECHIGFYCDSQGICSDQLTEGNICRDDYDCLNSLGCNYGTCTKYYSIENGKRAESERFCLMGYIKDGFCQRGPRITNKQLPYTCKRNSTFIEKCVYTEPDGKTFSLDCECGINNEGISYCPLAKGDPEFFSYLETVKKVYSHPCHTLGRNDPKLCDRIDKNHYRNLQQSSWVFHRHHLLQNNEFCVKETVLFEYYHLSFSSHIAFSVLGLIVFIVLIF